MEALIDSNVLIAAVVDHHPHHAASLSFLSSRPPRTFAVAAHSLAETYSQLARRGESARIKRSPDEALAALDRLAAATVLVGLTPAQTLDTIRSYAAQGGIGPRL